MFKAPLLAVMLFCPVLTLGAESTKPPKPLNSLQLAAKINAKIPAYSHIKLKGVCVWLTKKFPPKMITAPAIAQFVPDLIVTVSNQPGQNPWMEANMLVENKLALAGYQAVYQEAMGVPLGFGNDSMLINPAHLNEGYTRVVSVFGAPPALRLPSITHRPETAFPAVYYSSLADAVMERTEAAELAYMATHPDLLVGHAIGSATSHWGFEIPRLMHVTQPSRFRASVVAAMHAADIVTNASSLHAGINTSNRCGKDCIIANVIHDSQRKKVIWHEVYPKNRLVKPGNAEDWGIEDEKAGHGNYIFVLWRRYEGCVEQKGQLISGVGMGKPPKR
ncbi:TIGR03756 family integrating conjugative element protein [Legionella fairfieldensis]|uniref:TIGR03756 family integrating conjugative element protein n=1 Tax=Legionella fairfieldensis TaxID=45064 RepID=UPI0009FCC575|nr:TIGR03756 family integrating conjugative element protein [Legionella fairfieldensis]